MNFCVLEVVVENNKEFSDVDSAFVLIPFFRVLEG